MASISEDTGEETPLQVIVKMCFSSLLTSLLVLSSLCLASNDNMAGALEWGCHLYWHCWPCCCTLCAHCSFVQVKVLLSFEAFLYGLHAKYCI